VGLAAASALIVLLASGVAVSRLASDDRPGRLSEAALPTPGGPADTSPSGSGIAGEQGTGPVGSAGGETFSSPAPTPPVVTDGAGTTGHRTGRSPSLSTPSPSTPSPAPGEDPSATAAGHGTPGRATPPSPAAEPDGSSAGGAPHPGSQQPPGPAPLLAASVSAGRGATGGVVGVAFGNGPDADVTVGTTHVIGDAPPSRGTGVGLGSRFLQPPPTIPLLPG
jgi:hypothetical protein